MHNTVYLTSERGCTIWGTLQVNLSFVWVCVWEVCVCYCLLRLLESRRLERGRRCSCKYLMSSMRYRCPALDLRQKWTPDSYDRPASDSIWLGDNRDKKAQGRINLENCSFSLSGFILFVARRRNGSIKCAIKCEEEMWAVSWLCKVPRNFQHFWYLTGKISLDTVEQ